MRFKKRGSFKHKRRRSKVNSYKKKGFRIKKYGSSRGGIRL